MSRCCVSSAGQALQLLPQKLTFCCTQYLSFWGQSPTSIHVAVMASACLRASPVSDCIHSRSGTAKTKAGVYLAWLMTFSRFMPTPHSGRWPQAISGFTQGKNRQSPRRVDFVSAPRPATVNLQPSACRLSGICNVNCMGPDVRRAPTHYLLRYNRNVPIKSDSH